MSTSNKKTVTFTGEVLEEASFKAWLSKRYLIPSFGPKGPFEIGTLEELKAAIQEDLEAGGENTNELLDSTTYWRETSDEIDRKSIRVGCGEYLKLTRIKLLEDTSFSVVVVRLLQSAMRLFLNEVKASAEEWPLIEERWNRLMKLTDSWESQLPAPRSRDMDIELYWDKDSRLVKDSERPADMDRAAQAIVDYAVGAIEKRIYKGHPKTTWPREYVDLAERYAKDWRAHLLEGGFPPLALRSKPDPEDEDAITVTPTVVPAEIASPIPLFHVDGDLEEELFRTYGEANVFAFFNLFTIHSGRSSEGRYQGIESSREKTLSFSWEVELPLCKVRVDGPDKVDVQVVGKLPDEQDWEEWSFIWNTMQKMGSWMPLDVQAYFSSELELAKTRKVDPSFVILGSQKFTGFLKLATKMASTNEHFSAIKTVNSYRIRILDQKQIISRLETLVNNIFSRRSVISFFINRDLSRALPLVLQKIDWLSLANEYLARRSKSQSN
jgi:hypothetical protein